MEQMKAALAAATERAENAEILHIRGDWKHDGNLKVCGSATCVVKQENAVLRRALEDACNAQGLDGIGYLPESHIAEARKALAREKGADHAPS